MPAQDQFGITIGTSPRPSLTGANHQRAAAYAAKVITTNLQKDPPQFMPVTIWHGPAEVIEVTGYDDTYRARIADADIYDAVAGTATRDHFNYIIKALNDAIAEARK